MNQKTLYEYFDKIAAKRDELIKAQILRDYKYADCCRKELELLMDLCFNDEDGNLLILGE